MSKIKIGIFGGSFNPFHNGHLNCVNTAIERANLDKVHVIPAGKSPLKPEIDSPTAQERLEMLEIAFRDYSDTVIVDDRELKRAGPSFTIDTLKELQKENPEAELYLILGLDAFENLDQWKEPKEILSLANLIVCTRPGLTFPFTSEDFPKSLVPTIQAYDGKLAYLKSDKSIEFIRLKDVPASSTEIRKRLRTGRGTDSFLDIEVEKYIHEHHLYAPVGPKIGDYREFTQFCAKHLEDRKAVQLRAFDLRELNAVTDFTIVGSGTSTRHATSLVDHLMEEVKNEFGVNPVSLEGREEGRWVVVDYGGAIIHIFYDYVRQQYRLEEIWKGAKEIQL